MTETSCSKKYGLISLDGICKLLHVVPADVGVSLMASAALRRIDIDLMSEQKEFAAQVFYLSRFHRSSCEIYEVTSSGEA